MATACSMDPVTAVSTGTTGRPTRRPTGTPTRATTGPPDTTGPMDTVRPMSIADRTTTGPTTIRRRITMAPFSGSDWASGSAATITTTITTSGRLAAAAAKG